MVTPPGHQSQSPQQPTLEGKNEMDRIQAFCQTKCKYVVFVVMLWEGGGGGGRDVRLTIGESPMFSCGERSFACDGTHLHEC